MSKDLENQDVTAAPEADVLKNEDGYLAALIGLEKNLASATKTITLKDVGLTFCVRALTQDQTNELYRQSAKYVRHPLGPKYPQIEDDTKFDNSKYSSLRIVAATVDEDKKKLWHSPKIMSHFGIVSADEAWRIVDKVLPYGRKNEIIGVIDGLSNPEDGVSDNDAAKNS